MTYRFYEQGRRGVGFDLPPVSANDAAAGMKMVNQYQNAVNSNPDANKLVNAAQQRVQAELTNRAKAVIPPNSGGGGQALEVIIKNGENFVNDVASGKDVEASFRAALSAGAAEGMVVGAAIVGTAVCGIIPFTAPIAPLCGMGLAALTQALPLAQIVGPAVGTVMDTIRNVDIGFKDLDRGDIGGALEMFGQSFFDSVDEVVRAFTGPDWDKYHRDSVNQYWIMSARLQGAADVVARTERMAIAALMNQYNKAINALLQSDTGGLAQKYGLREITFDEARQRFESKYSGTIGATNYHGVTKMSGWNLLANAGDNFTISRLENPRRILPMYCDCGDRIPMDPINPNLCCHVPMNMIPQVFPDLASFDTNFSKRFNGVWWPEGWAPEGRPFDGDTYAYLWGVCGRHLTGSMTKWSGVAQWYLYDLQARMAQIPMALLSALKAQTADLIDLEQRLNAGKADSAYSALTAYRAKSAYSSKIALQTQAFLAQQEAAKSTSSTTTWLMLGAVGAGLAWYFWPKKH